MSSFDTRAYWEERLGADWSLRGVGFRRMGERFNEWAYRLRGEQFDAIVADLVPDHASARVLDIGSGTGFYIDTWRRLGAGSVAGMDLTEAAVGRLRGAFPGVEFVRNDITEGIGGLPAGSFDIISCMDVLFHVVEVPKFEAALRNIAELLSPGGCFVWSDFFVHGHEIVDGHIAWRNLYRIESLLDQAGLEVVGRKPLFYLMNEPRDTSSKTALLAWQGLMLMVSTSERAGDVAGRALYRLDKRLCSRRLESPSTEVMVCRKRATP